MIHDTERVASIRARIAAQLEMINALESRIVKGKLDALAVARNQTTDIETLFLQDLERQHRTPAEEARWLSAAKRMLQQWDPYLQQTQEQFSKYGEAGVELAG